MVKTDQYVVGLDIGSFRIRCVVGEIREDGGVDLVGIGETPSKGIRKGVVVNLDATVEATKACVHQAETMAGVAVESALIGIAGSHVRSFNSRGVVAVASRDRTVGQDDVDRVLEAARSVSIPPDREILHVLPQEFVLDDQSGIHTPTGMSGNRLEANVHVITASSSSVQNLFNCANRSGVSVREPVLQQLAISEAVLTADERELGVAVIDVGGGTTEVAVFERGSLWHTAAFPVGGDHFSNDLAVGLRTPVPEAEKLKVRHGCALAEMIEEDTELEVPTVGGGRTRTLSRQVMAEILQPRAEEVFSLIRDELVRAGFDRVLNAGVVLTGGATRMPGMTEVAEQVFGLPVRSGMPRGVDGLVDPASGPEHATVVGLALYGARHRPVRKQAGIGKVLGRETIVGLPGRMRSWFSQIF